MDFILTIMVLKYLNFGQSPIYYDVICEQTHEILKLLIKKLLILYLLHAVFQTVQA